MFEVGIIGLGYIGERHLKKFSELKQVNIAAIADKDSQKLRKYADMYPAAGHFVDYRLMFGTQRLDLVVVCLPNHLHTEACITALNAGHHVLCEKPLATSVAAAERMISVASSNKRILCVAMNFRWDFFGPDIFSLKRIIEEGGLGTLYYIRMKYLRRVTFSPSGAHRWNLFKKFSGGGALIDLGPHMLDLAMWLADNYDPMSVKGLAYNGLIKYADVDDFASGFISLGSGIDIQLEVAWSCHNEPLWEISLFGEKGGANVSALKPPGDRVKLYSNHEDQPITLPLEKEVHAICEGASLQEHVVTRLNARRIPDCSADKALQVMRVIEAWYRSSKSRTERFL